LHTQLNRFDSLVVPSGVAIHHNSNRDETTKNWWKYRGVATIVHLKKKWKFIKITTYLWNWIRFSSTIAVISPPLWSLPFDSMSTTQKLHVIPISKLLWIPTLLQLVMCSQVH